MSAIPIDLEALDNAHGRLKRALELVTTIRAAGRELAELVGTDNADGAVLRALEPAHAAETVRQELDHAEAPAAPPSPPRPDPSPAAPPAADDGPPAAPPAPPSSPPAGPIPPNARAARPDVLEYLEARAGAWVAIADISRDLTHHSLGALRQAVRRLAADGELEHNGRPTSASRYRFPTVAVEPEQGDDDAPAATGPAADPQPDPPAAPTPTPPAATATTISPRVRRELERERTAALAEPANPLAGTIEGRITEALEGGGPCGIRELARRIGRAHPDDTLVRTLATLIRHGDIRRFENPRRAQVGEENPHFEVNA